MLKKKKQLRFGGEEEESLSSPPSLPRDTYFIFLRKFTFGFVSYPSTEEPPILRAAQKWVGFL